MNVRFCRRSSAIAVGTEKARSRTDYLDERDNVAGVQSGGATEAVDRAKRAANEVRRLAANVRREDGRMSRVAARFGRREGNV